MENTRTDESGPTFEEQGFGEEFIELTPEQEATMLVGEFSEFAESLKLAIPHIPEENKSVSEKIVQICDSLKSLDEKDMLILFHAMEKAHPERIEDYNEDK